MQRWVRTVFAVVVGISLISATRVDAKGGSALTVTTTAAVNGTLVQGVVTIANGSSKALVVSSVTDQLEVRYATGGPATPLPPGSTSGYYVVATRGLSAPIQIGPLATVNVPYAFDVCAGEVAGYQGAKDMRNAAVVVVPTESATARSANFTAPTRSLCPVCGNGIREGNEQCDGGACCTASCTLAADGTGCTDGNACTSTDVCQSGVCRGSGAVTCPAADQCHDAGICNPSTGACSNPARPNGTSCNDGSACSINDTCTNGLCTGAPLSCDDGNACTTDSCSAGACLHTNNEAACEDGRICTAGDTCVDGTCVGGGPADCDDLETCTDDGCTEDAGCTHAPTAVCEGCFGDECLLCRDQCTVDRTACTDRCWASFLGCLNGCTSTYCAPFCQTHLGPCFDACPAEDACFAQCDAGNGCAPGCAEP